MVTVVNRSVPVQSPPHPVKVEPEFGLAVRVTTVPLEKLALQAAPQSIPTGEEVTVPPPLPVTVTLRGTEPSWIRKSLTAGALGAGSILLATTLIM
jgi:hypothetical protein